MPSNTKLNHHIAGNSIEEDEAAEAKVIIELLGDAEWVLATMSKDQMGMGKQAQKSETNEIKRKMTQERTVRRKLAAQNIKNKQKNEEF